MSETPVAALGLGFLAPVLAFLLGFVDTAAFIHMQSLFVAHVTGNFVLLGAAAVASGGEGSGHEVLQLAALPIFFTAAMLTGAIAPRLAPARSLAAFLWGAALLMARGPEAKMLRAVIAFALGCAAGAARQVWLGLVAVGIPAALLALRPLRRG